MRVQADAPNNKDNEKGTETTLNKDDESQKIQDLFHKVTSIIQNSPVTPSNKVSDEIKLKLYGLYKRSTLGQVIDEEPDHDNYGDYDANDNEYQDLDYDTEGVGEDGEVEKERVVKQKRPSAWNIVERYKYDSWASYNSLTRDEAMMQYVIAATSEKREGNNVAAACADLLDKYLASSSNPTVAVGGGGDNKSSGIIQMNSTSTRKASIFSSLSQMVETYLGIHPFLPRGQLDISYHDLFYALGLCLKPTLFSREAPMRAICRLEQDIATTWNTTIVPNDAKKKNVLAHSRVITGLSVRSLLDLYLSSRNYEPQSEVIIVPPINIEGMVQIMQHHDLKIVPVDIPDFQRGEEDPVVRVDLDAVKRVITERTVAIIVVHPFGLVCMTEEEMANLRKIAKSVTNDNDEDDGDENNKEKRRIDIIEDCAECFTGGEREVAYTGSKHADLCFFSFGTIKTATALGGGIAILHDDDNEEENRFPAKALAEKMQRIQHTMYGQQSRNEYLKKVLKSLLLTFVSRHPLLCGILIMINNALGLDYDSWVSNAIKGFNNDAFLKTSNHSTKEDLQKLKIRVFMEKIRKRPSSELLSLLLRRLRQSDITSARLASRVKRCTTMGNLIHQNQLNIQIPKGVEDSKHLYWLYPILVQDPDVISRNLKDANFDVPRGMSQLGCVTSFLSESESEKCPNAKYMMDHILYMPVASQHLSEITTQKLLTSLKSAVRMNSDDESKMKVKKCRSSSRTKESLGTILLFTSMFVALLIHTQYLEVSFLVDIIAYFSIGVTVILIIIHVLRVMLGDFYLNSSRTFAKYSPMLSHLGSETAVKKPTLPEASKNSEMPIMNCEEAYEQSKDILNIDILRVPDVQSAPNNAKSAQNDTFVILAGATGYVGSLLLRDLLLNYKKLCISGVILICRSKRGKSARARIDDILSKPMFSFLSNDQKTNMITVVEGDLQQPSFGMTGRDISLICNELTITHVFNCAASVSFTDPIEKAATSNITSALQLQELARKMKKNKAHYIYVSTAFIHGSKKGSSDMPLPEDLFHLGKYDAQKLYKSMILGQAYASKAMHDLGFPNTYTFSKCICEHLLLRDTDVQTTIVRPSIIGPSVQEPYEGWAGDKPSTIVAASCLYLKNQFNLWSFKKRQAPVVPVDVVSRYIIAKGFQPQPLSSSPKDCDLDTDSSESYSIIDEENSGTSTNDGTPPMMKRIYTATWNFRSSKKAGFLWYDYAFATIHLGSVQGHINRSVLYLNMMMTFKILQAVTLTYESFQWIHNLLIRVPLRYLQWICSKVGWTSKLARQIEQLGPFLDLPVLFFPFTTSTFYFESDLVAPEDMNGERYMFSCALAALNFVTILEKKIEMKKNAKKTTIPKSSQSPEIKTVGGRNHIPNTKDIFWVLSQPVGSFAIRTIGWVVIKILRRISSNVTVDITSFAHTQRVFSERMKRGKKKPFIILAPTHRSLLDFVLLSFVMFSLPELGIDVPYIAAADEFSRDPVLGWLVRAARAFFLKRGKGAVDPELGAQLQAFQRKNEKRKIPMSIEVFLEGKRSRDRRFLAPKTGFLKCLSNCGCDCVVVPITINYEGIPDQRMLVSEIEGKTKGKLSIFFLLKWLKDAWNGKINLGKIHLAAASPLLINSENQLEAPLIAKTIQQLQETKIVVSNYHIDSGASILKIKPDIMRKILLELNCQFWPTLVNDGEDEERPSLPRSAGERWAIFLHYGHVFAPFLADTSPSWSSWLSLYHADKTNDLQSLSDKNIQPIVESLEHQFHAADAAVDKTLRWLRGKGFMQPNFDHSLQYVLQQNRSVPPLLAATALTFKLDTTEDDFDDSIGDASPIQPLFDPKPKSPLKKKIESPKDMASLESIGAWGFSDSKFVVNVSQKGTRTVTMGGERYSICGKPMAKLIPFLESESKLKVNALKTYLPSTSSHLDVSESDLTAEDIDKLILIFDKENDRVSLDSVERARHGTGHSQEDMYMIRSGELSAIRLPDVIVYPKVETEVESLVCLAFKEKWCLIPFGGGTNVTNATRCPSKEVDPRPMISVDMRLMNSIIKINEEDATAHVHAGITGRDLVEEMKSRGFTIGHEPDSIEFSTLGGWIATKASGMKQNKYGNIENIVKDVRVAGPNGIMWQNNGGEGPSFGRVSTGLELSSLMIGSEGSFGIITSAVIKLWPLPEIQEYESIILHDFDDGIRFVRDVSKMGMLKPSSVRLLDNQQFRLGQAMKPVSSGIQRLKSEMIKLVGGVIAPTLQTDKMVCTTITFEGTISEVRLQKQMIKELAAKHGGLCAGPDIGKAGYDMTFAIAYLRDFAMSYGFLGDSFETFVPWSKLTSVIKETKTVIIKEHQERALPGMPLLSCRITQLYDEGVCVYFYFCMNFENVANPSKVFHEIECAARKTILDTGGSLSHHHGVGKIRAPFMDNVNSRNMKNLCKEIKHAIDPENIFGVRNGVYHSE